MSVNDQTPPTLLEQLKQWEELAAYFKSQDLVLRVDSNEIKVIIEIERDNLRGKDICVLRGALNGLEFKKQAEEWGSEGGAVEATQKAIDALMAEIRSTIECQILAAVKSSQFAYHYAHGKINTDTPPL